MIHFQDKVGGKDIVKVEEDEEKITYEVKSLI
jgi:hypothetical protein